MSFSYNFQTFDTKKYMGDEDIKAIIDLMVKYIVEKAIAQKHSLTYDEIVKILNAFWWKKEVKDTIIQNVWSACHPNSNINNNNF
jgi:hypothetical protein